MPSMMSAGCFAMESPEFNIILDAQIATLSAENSPINLVGLVAHDCGYPLSRYTCRATRVAADFLDFIAFCRCSTGVALHPPKNFGVAPPPPCPRRCRTEIWV